MFGSAAPVILCAYAQGHEGYSSQTRGREGMLSLSAALCTPCCTFSPGCLWADVVGSFGLWQRGVPDCFQATGCWIFGSWMVCIGGGGFANSSHFGRFTTHLKLVQAFSTALQDRSTFGGILGAPPHKSAPHPNGGLGIRERFLIFPVFVFAYPGVLGLVVHK